jgi:HD-like signal output (HDOD) protein
MSASEKSAIEQSGSESTLFDIKQLDQLPIFPASASAIMHECNKKKAEVKRIIQLIESEPAVGPRILSLVNSPVYGVSRPITSIGQAVVLLGLKSVAQTAIATAAKAVFGEGTPEMAAHREKAFVQSLACATLARILASQSRIANPDEAFLCGVMHDVGKLVFFKAVPEIYVEILDSDPTGHTVDEEVLRIGISHTEVGKNCGVCWGLPPAINDVIAGHHASIAACPSALAQTVIAANHFARQWQIGFDETESTDANPLIEEAFTGLELVEIEAQFRDQFAAVEEIYLA